MNPLVKVGDKTYWRDVFAVKRLQSVWIATSAYCHSEKLGNLQRTVFDDVQEPKSRRKIILEMGGAGVLERLAERFAAFSNALLAAAEI